VEEIGPVTAGANLGWNDWEGSYRYPRPRTASAWRTRGDPKVTYPIVDYGQLDPLFQPSSAAIGGLVYRANKIKQLSNLLLFGDNPSGEIFYVSADNLPKGGQSAIRRVLFNDKGTNKTLLQLIKEKKRRAGQAARHPRRPALRRRQTTDKSTSEQARRHHPAAPVPDPKK
jgi:hypothetical protein